jgi:hypothetical protein
VTGKRVDDEGEHVVEIRTAAVNQRGETVMPGSAVIALPVRGIELGAESPAGRRARRDA